MNQREIRKQELIDTATELFSKKGYEATTIKDISHVIGRNQAIVYYYFPDKQALLYAAMSSGLKILMTQVKRVAKMPISPGKKLDLLIKEHINQLAINRPAQSIAHSELRHLTPRNRRKFIADRDKYEEIFRNVIKEGIEQGEFRQADGKMACIFILQIINSTTNWYNSDGEYTLKEICDILLDFINKGIKA
jgi:AcrR family transcriptional regulator